MSRTTARGIERLYDGLSRYQWWRRRLARPQPGAALEMHKRLTGGDETRPAAGQAGLDAWLAERLSPLESARVLDIGCGFGATLFALVQRGAQGGLGVTLSEYQVRRARQQARALGVGDDVRFAVQRMEDPLDGRFDVAVSIETLLHVPDLDAAIASIAAALKPCGRCGFVEDVRTPGAPDDPDAAALLAHWSSAKLHTLDDYRGALGRHGFAITDEIDLSEQVASRPTSTLDASERRLQRLRRCVPIGRSVVDAFLGGIALERLYARGGMRYVALFADLGRACR